MTVLAAAVAKMIWRSKWGILCRERWTLSLDQQMKPRGKSVPRNGQNFQALMPFLAKITIFSKTKWATHFRQLKSNLKLSTKSHPFLHSYPRLSSFASEKQSRQTSTGLYHFVPLCTERRQVHSTIQKNIPLYRMIKEQIPRKKLPTSAL